MKRKSENGSAKREEKTMDYIEDERERRIDENVDVREQN